MRNAGTGPLTVLTDENRRIEVHLWSHAIPPRRRPPEHPRECDRKCDTIPTRFPGCVLTSIWSRPRPGTDWIRAYWRGAKSPGSRDQPPESSLAKCVAKSISYLPTQARSRLVRSPSRSSLHHFGVRDYTTGVSRLFTALDGRENCDLLHDFVERCSLGEISHGLDDQLFVRHARISQCFKRMAVSAWPLLHPNAQSVSITEVSRALPRLGGLPPYVASPSPSPAGAAAGSSSSFSAALRLSFTRSCSSMAMTLTIITSPTLQTSPTLFT
jgi:hypothetical protein